MNKNDTIKQLIFEHIFFGVKTEKTYADLNETDSLEELGADSLDTMEIIIVFEDMFGCIVKPEDEGGFKTVGDFIRYADKHGLDVPED
jgi:acyl carrier protein